MWISLYYNIKFQVPFQVARKVAFSAVLNSGAWLAISFFRAIKKDGLTEGRAPIYHTWVILSNHHPSQTARHSFFCFCFSISVGQPPLPVWPTRPISVTLTQTPLPQLTAWSQFMAEEPKKIKKDKKRLKKGTKGQKGRGAG